MKHPVLPLICALLCPLSGCLSEAEINAAKKVITALPQEVLGCTFLADVDSSGSAIIENARFFLQLEASRHGATHVVEQFAYPVLIGPRTIGVAMTGRAYRCPVGSGPKVEGERAHLPFEIPSADQLLGDREGPAGIPNIDWTEEYRRQQQR